jgi:hypothetical protein
MLFYTFLAQKKLFYRYDMENEMFIGGLKKSLAKRLLSNRVLFSEYLI